MIYTLVCHLNRNGTAERVYIQWEKARVLTDRTVKTDVSVGARTKRPAFRSRRHAGELHRLRDLARAYSAISLRNLMMNTTDPAKTSTARATRTQTHAGTPWPPDSEPFA